MSESELCKCGKPHDGWPGENGEDQLCQDCWERECDKSWWQMVKALDAITHFGKESE